MTTNRPDVSLIIPVHNEAGILRSAVDGLVTRLQHESWSWEIILAENGSTDETSGLAHALAATHRGLRVMSHPKPNYGEALKAGILQARGAFVICLEIDLCDVDFCRRALATLQRGRDLVVGSKCHPDSRDRRPWLRRLATSTLNALLRGALNFRGTDTHGLKAFRRQALLPVVQQCRVGHNLFASELVIRACRSALRVDEIHLNVAEIRPTPVGLLNRIPHALFDLSRLVLALRWRQ